MSKQYVPIVIIADNENGKAMVLYSDRTYISASFLSLFDYDFHRPFIQFPVFGKGKIGDWTTFAYPQFSGDFVVLDPDETIFNNEITKNAGELAIAFGYWDINGSTYSLLFAGEVTSVNYDYIEKTLTFSFVDLMNALRNKRWSFPRCRTPVFMGTWQTTEYLPVPYSAYTCSSSKLLMVGFYLGNHTKQKNLKVGYIDGSSHTDYWGYETGNDWDYISGTFVFGSSARHGITITSWNPIDSSSSYDNSGSGKGHYLTGNTGYSYVSYLNELIAYMLGYFSNVRMYSFNTDITSNMLIRATDFRPYQLIGQTGFYVKKEDLNALFDPTNQYIKVNVNMYSSFGSTVALNKYIIKAKKMVSTGRIFYRYNGRLKRGNVTEDTSTSNWRFTIEDYLMHMNYCLWSDSVSCISLHLIDCGKDFRDMCRYYKEAVVHDFTENGDVDRGNLIFSPFVSTNYSPFSSNKQYEVLTLLVKFWDFKDKVIGDQVTIGSNTYWINKMKYDLYSNLIELEVIREI